MWEVVVDKDKCVGDEECVDACPAHLSLSTTTSHIIKPPCKLIIG